MSVARVAEIREAEQEHAQDAASKNTLPYIDPSDSDRSLQLPTPLKPTMSKLSTKDVLLAKHMPPLDTLPRILIPSPRTAIIPPVMLYGWVADEDFLLSYARCNDMRVPPNIDLAEIDDSPEPFVPPPERGADDVTPGGVEHTFLITAAFEQLMEDIDPEWPEGTATLAFGLNGGYPRVASIFTNYHIPQAPSWERIMLVKHALGMKEDPKWFLASERCRWRPNPTLRR